MSAPQLKSSSFWPADFGHVSKPAPWPAPPASADVRIEPAKLDPATLALVDDGYKAGLLVGGAQGVSEGYIAGWRWGVVCGAVGTTLLGAAVFLAFLTGLLT